MFLNTRILLECMNTTAESIDAKKIKQKPDISCELWDTLFINYYNEYIEKEAQDFINQLRYHANKNRVFRYVYNHYGVVDMIKICNTYLRRTNYM